MTPRVLIVGAGIAGLALARALRRRDITADVVERMPEWETSGAGLYLPGNSVRALRELGLWEELAARANPIVRQRFLDHRGRGLADIDVRSYWDGVAGWRVLEVWELEQDAKRFRDERLMPAFDAAGVPRPPGPPQVWQLHDYMK